MQGFLDFVRTQGVVGLAVGVIIGGAVGKVVSSIVQDIVSPLIGLLLGKAGNLSEMALHIGNATIKYGNFISTLIDFVVIAGVVYFGVKMLKLEKIDKPKA